MDEGDLGMPRKNLPQNAGTIRDLAVQFREAAKRMEDVTKRMDRMGINTPDETIEVAHIRPIEDGLIKVEWFLRELTFKLDRRAAE